MEKYKYYIRKVNYYETDKMGIVHHSNYARYLEEARIDMLEYYGIPLEVLEQNGIMIPVLQLSGKFTHSLLFGQTVKIVVEIDKASSVKFGMSYKIYDEEMKEVLHLGNSEHCFLDMNFRPVPIKRLPAEIAEKINVMREVYGV